MQFIEYTGGTMDDIEVTQSDRVERAGDYGDPVHDFSVPVGTRDQPWTCRCQLVLSEEIPGLIVEAAGKRIAQRRVFLQLRVGIQHLVGDRAGVADELPVLGHPQ